MLNLTEKTLSDKLYPQSTLTLFSWIPIPVGHPRYFDQTTGRSGAAASSWQPPVNFKPPSFTFDYFRRKKHQSLSDEVSLLRRECRMPLSVARVGQAPVASEQFEMFEFDQAEGAGLVSPRIPRHEQSECGCAVIPPEKQISEDFFDFKDLMPWHQQPQRTFIDIVPGGAICRKEGLKTKFASVGGGVRGDICGFSEESRSRMMERLMRFDFDRYSSTSKKSKSGHSLFVTLTYPDTAYRQLDSGLGHGFCPVGDSGYNGHFYPDQIKRDIEVFSKRLRRLNTFSGMLWKMEIEPRKSGKRKGQYVPHFHCLILFDKPKAISRFRQWLSLAWFSVVGSKDSKHLAAGTQAIIAYGGCSGRLLSYLSKYLAKSFEVEFRTGRIWGMVSRSKDEKNPLKLVKPQTLVADPSEWRDISTDISSWGEKSKYLSTILNRNATKIFGDSDSIRCLVENHITKNYEYPPLSVA